MLTYEFMRVAFVVAILLGLAIPLIGSQAVYKRLSSSGDALAHSSLAGVAIGLVAGISPLIMAIISCVIAFFIIELLRKKFSKYSEIGVVAVMSAAIAIAGIISSYGSSYNLESYLFGSILLIGDTELYVTIALSIVIVLFTIIFYRPTFALLMSENEARVQGIKVGALNITMDLLLAITVAVGAKVVGSLVVSCLMVLPTAIALQMKKGYKVTLIASAIFSVASMIIGLTISYYAECSSGSAIVGVAVIFLIVMFIYRFLRGLYEKKKSLSLH